LAAKLPPSRLFGPVLTSDVKALDGPSGQKKISLIYTLGGKCIYLALAWVGLRPTLVIPLVKVIFHFACTPEPASARNNRLQSEM